MTERVTRGRLQYCRKIPALNIPIIRSHFQWRESGRGGGGGGGTLMPYIGRSLSQNGEVGPKEPPPPPPLSGMHYLNLEIKSLMYIYMYNSNLIISLTTEFSSSQMVFFEDVLAKFEWFHFYFIHYFFGIQILKF